MTKPTDLALYDTPANTKICADASAYGLGAVLLQQHTDMHWKPIAYASRSSSDTERRYSQIEKEALAIAWACEKFANYILRKAIHLETDHKPLVPLLNRTNLESLPARVLRFRLHLSRFDYSIRHTLGKLLYTADTLSCAPNASTCSTHIQEESQTAFFASALVPPCQQAKIAWTSTGQLNKRAAPVASSSPYANRDGLTDPISREIFRHIGTGEETSPSMTPSPIQLSCCCSQEPASRYTAEDPQWTSRHPEVPPVHYLIGIVAWSV